MARTMTVCLNVGVGLIAAGVFVPAASAQPVGVNHTVGFHYAPSTPPSSVSEHAFEAEEVGTGWQFKVDGKTVSFDGNSEISCVGPSLCPYWTLVGDHMLVIKAHSINQTAAFKPSLFFVDLRQDELTAVNAFADPPTLNSAARMKLRRDPDARVMFLFFDTYTEVPPVITTFDGFRTLSHMTLYDAHTGQEICRSSEDRMRVNVADEADPPSVWYRASYEVKTDSLRTSMEGSHADERCCRLPLDEANGEAGAVLCPLDTDGDGVEDGEDNCPAFGGSNPLQEDQDGDLVGDVCDNCPGDPNENQLDSDDNGTGDACEPAPPPTKICPSEDRKNSSDPRGTPKLECRYAPYDGTPLTDVWGLDFGWVTVGRTKRMVASCKNVGSGPYEVENVALLSTEIDGVRAFAFTSRYTFSEEQFPECTVEEFWEAAKIDVGQLMEFHVEFSPTEFPQSSNGFIIITEADTPWPWTIVPMQGRSLPSWWWWLLAVIAAGGFALWLRGRSR